MKNLLVALTVVLMSVPAFAQHRPNRRPMPGPGHNRPRPMPRPTPGPGHYRPRPMPRPMPTRLCSVVMLNRANRVINRYTGYADYRNGMCQVALQNCRYDLNRRGAWGNRCVQTRN